MSLKKEIYEEMRYITKEMKIDTSGYSARTFGILISDTIIAGNEILTVELILGEEVKRLDDKEDVYALTYQKKNYINAQDKNSDELIDDLLENIDQLLSEFADQYKEDNE